MESENISTRNIIKDASKAGKKANKIYLNTNLDYEVYKEVKEYAIENHYDISTVIENFLANWVEMKKSGKTDKKIIKDYVIKGKGSVLNKKPFNPTGSAIHINKSTFNITMDVDLLYQIKTDPQMREINISAACNKFLRDLYNELHINDKKTEENEIV